MEKDNVELKPFDDHPKRAEELWRQRIAAQQSTGKKEVEKHTAELLKTNEKLRRELKHRKRLEKALLESEQRFRLLADYTRDWEYWIAPDGNYRANA